MVNVKKEKRKKIKKVTNPQLNDYCQKHYYRKRKEDFGEIELRKK